jgi:hypothetical protein
MQLENLKTKGEYQDRNYVGGSVLLVCCQGAGLIYIFVAEDLQDIVTIPSYRVESE